MNGPSTGSGSGGSENGCGGSGRVQVIIDGDRVVGFEGQTIAGVLLAAGRRSWRVTGNGQPRGVFCGIGVCFDCLVTVNGVADVRACRRTARDGDVIELQDGRR